MSTRQGKHVLVNMEVTCGSLLWELQEIWDDVGEPQKKRDKILMEIEQECVEAYRKRVDEAYQFRAQIRQAIADSEAELAQIYSALGERPSNTNQSDETRLCLMEELNAISPCLEEMKKRKIARKKMFVEVLEQIRDISNEISPGGGTVNDRTVDETDLSLKKLEELHTWLHSLQKQKSDRLKQVLDLLKTLSSLCSVLGMDFKDKVCKIHPSLHDSNGTRNISDDTIQKLTSTIQSLKDIKIQRLEKLQDLASTMVELWSLMDTPAEEQHMFQNVISKIAASEEEITEAESLSMNFLSNVEAEVWRLENLKSSKLKDLLLKKRSDLEDICRNAHMVLEPQNSLQYSTEVIESGAVDLVYLLEQIEIRIADAKEEAFSRKEILERTDKWLAACQEECWLEEYNRDDNRYNAGRGAHLSLKRAEKARVLVNKIPGMMDVLTTKARVWKEERGTEFLYDGVPLLSMLEQYNNLRQEKEREHQRQREERKLQGQLLTKQEAIFGSKPSPTKSGRKAPRYSIGVAAYGRYSLGGQVLQNSKPIKADNFHPTHKPSRVHQNNTVYQQNGGKRSLATPNPHTYKRQPNFAAALENQSQIIRNPLSPVPSRLTSNVNKKNSQESENKLQVSTLQEDRGSSTPTKQTSGAGDHEMVTPPNKLRTLASTMLPPSSCISVQSFTTPAMPPIIMPITSPPVDAVRATGQDVEYSFEEIRAGFAFPERNMKSLLHV